MKKLLIFALLLMLPFYVSIANALSQKILSFFMTGERTDTILDCPLFFEKMNHHAQQDSGSMQLSIKIAKDKDSMIPVTIWLDNNSDSSVFLDMRFLNLESFFFLRNGTLIYPEYFKAWTEYSYDLAYLYFSSDMRIQINIPDIAPIRPKKILNEGAYDVKFEIVTPPQWHNKSKWIWYNDLSSNEIHF